MRQKPIFLIIFCFVMSLLTLLCLWYAFSEFRAAATMRQVKAKSVSANLTIDWGTTDESATEEPLYKLVIDLVAMDESKRNFHWEGDPGEAVYPEEAIDSLERFAPGTEHTVSILRGNARELRFDHFEYSPEIGKGFAWTFGAVFAALIGVAAYVAMDKSGPMGRLRRLWSRAAAGCSADWVGKRAENSELEAGHRLHNR